MLTFRDKNGRIGILETNVTPSNTAKLVKTQKKPAKQTSLMSGSNNSLKMAWTNTKPFPRKNRAGRLLQPSKPASVKPLSLGLLTAHELWEKFKL